MLESLRLYGYSLNSAISDIIDNSIAAKAKNIWVYLIWKGSDSCIYIRDDGLGISESELSAASKSPGSGVAVWRWDLDYIAESGLPQQD
jgi:signal transduction histidine kinase